MAEIKFEIVKNIGVISESSSGWTKELNLISWNGREPKGRLKNNFTHNIVIATYESG